MLHIIFYDNFSKIFVKKISQEKIQQKYLIISNVRQCLQKKTRQLRPLGNTERKKQKVKRKSKSTLACHVGGYGQAEWRTAASRARKFNSARWLFWICRDKGDTDPHAHTDTATESYIYNFFMSPLNYEGPLIRCIQFRVLLLRSSLVWW